MAGRKLSFDPEIALEKMMRVFWAKGYAGTSVDDLCRAVGVPKPSLYSYFGDKEAILIHALKFYGDRSPQCHACSQSGSFAERLTSIMLSTRFEGALETASPSGCFLVNMIAEFMGVSPAVDKALADISRLTDIGLVDFFEEARSRGEIRRDLDAKLLAVQVNTFIRGIAISRRAGRSARMIREQVDFFVTTLLMAVQPSARRRSPEA
jgi:AcrR family transcriptional regulator